MSKAIPPVRGSVAWQPGGVKLLLCAMLATAMAAGMGWGIRGQFGHETGAMIAGTLAAFTLVLLFVPRASSLKAARAAAWMAVAIGIGGSMTYGQTIGLTHDHEIRGNWEALRWGMLGLFIKGGIWIGFGGLLLGMGLGGKRYRVGEMALLMLAALVLMVLGIWLINSPFDPHGKQIVSGSSDNTLKLWDAETGQEILTLQGHTDDVNSVAFSPDGTRIASGSRDQTVKVWDAETGRLVNTLEGHTDSVQGVTFSPDGQRIASGSQDTLIQIWDALTGQKILTLRGHTGFAESVKFSPDGKRIVGSGTIDNGRFGLVMVWNAETGQEMFTFQGHSDDSVVHSVAFSPDGKRIVSGSRDGVVQVWDVETGHNTPLRGGHSAPVFSVAFRPDGRRIVSGSGDRTVKVWDAETGQEMFTLPGHTDRVSSVAFSLDSKKIVSGSADNTVKVWDAETGEEILTLKGHSTSVSSVAFSPDNRILPTIYFSDSWYFEPLGHPATGKDLKPRPEVWGGFLLALIGMACYARFVRKDRLAGWMVIVGFLAGAIGFTCGQTLQAAHQWNPGLFAEQGALGFMHGFTRHFNWWNIMETTFGMIWGAIMALGLWLNRHLIDVEESPAEVTISPNWEVLLFLAHFILLLNGEFLDQPGRAALLAEYIEYGPLMAMIPLIAITGGRFWPYLLLFPTVAAPILGKALRGQCYQGDAMNMGVGWLMLVAIPMALMILAAIWLTERSRQDQTARSFAAIGLVITAWFYFAVNTVVFDYAWPWLEWTGRTSNQLIFGVCVIGLTITALVQGFRRPGGGTLKR